MRALLTGGAAALIALAAPAPAADWSLNGSFSQSFSGIFNPDLESESEGLAYGTTTTLGFTLGARTRRTVWSLSTGGTFRAFGGPGADDDLTRPDPNLRGAVSYRGQRFNMGANFSYSRGSTTFLTLVPISLEPPEDDVIDPDDPDLLPDQVLFERGVVRTSVATGVSASYRLSLRNTLTTSFNAGLLRYSGDDESRFTPTDSLGMRLGWSHRLSQISSLNVNTALRRFTADDGADTRTWTLSTTVGYATQVDPNTSLSADVGLSYFDRDRTLFGLGGLARRSENSVAFTGGVSTTFRQPGAAAFSLFANQSIRPSGVDGDVENVTSFGASYNQALTPVAGFSVVAQHSLGNAFGFDEEEELTQSFVFAPRLSYRLSPDWSAALGYSFRLSDDEDGLGIGNSVFLSFSRGIAIYP